MTTVWRSSRETGHKKLNAEESRYYMYQYRQRHRCPECQTYRGLKREPLGEGWLDVRCIACPYRVTKNYRKGLTVGRQ